MHRKSSASEPQARYILDRITEIDIRDIAFDFFRTVGPPQADMAMANIPSEIRNDPGYRPVAAAMQMACQDYRDGEYAKFNFLLGMAAAFYGLIRLNTAIELEARLAPALGLADATAKPRKPTESIVQGLDVKTFELCDLAAVLDADGIEYAFVHNKRALAAFFGINVGTISLIAQAISEAKCAYFLFGIPMSVRKHRRPEMALALTRANHGLNVGSFEMDLDNGRLSFKVAVPIDDACLSPDQMRHCLKAAFSIISAYVPAFRRIVNDGVSAEEAIKFVES